MPEITNQPVVQTTTQTQIINQIPKEPRKDTQIYPDFRDANPMSILGKDDSQTLAMRERARENRQGIRIGDGHGIVPIPEPVKFPTITGEREVNQRSITSFSEKVEKYSRYFSQYITGEDRKHWDALDKLQGRDTKIKYLDKNNLKGGIWDIARDNFKDPDSHIPLAREARSTQLRWRDQWKEEHGKK